MKKVKIIIPLYNEEESIPQLVEKLHALSFELDSEYDASYLFVDDGSKDETFNLLRYELPKFKNAELLKHEANKNLGGALKTGISHIEECDYVTFLDSDCTYEPTVLLEMLSELKNGYDFVTASPYHPRGHVEGVPAWRLILSKGLTFIYRFVLRKKIYTFTAMVRAIKFEHMKKLISERNDFTFVTVMMIKAIKENLQISEVPATLCVRKYGVSKMNTLKTIKAQLKIVGMLILRDRL